MCKFLKSSPLSVCLFFSLHTVQGCPPPPPQRQEATFPQPYHKSHLCPSFLLFPSHRSSWKLTHLLLLSRRTFMQISIFLCTLIFELGARITRHADRRTDGRTDGRVKPKMRPIRTAALRVRRTMSYRRDAVRTTRCAYVRCARTSRLATETWRRSNSTSTPAKAPPPSVSNYRVVQKKRGHSTFSQISRKLLKISKWFLAHIKASVCRTWHIHKNFSSSFYSVAPSGEYWTIVTNT